MSWEGIIAILALCGTAYQYFDKRKWERRWKEFETYHKLIEIVNNASGEKIGLHVQRAAVYELEYFKRYYPLTLKILEVQIDSWRRIGADKVLVEEMELLVARIKSTKRILKRNHTNKQL